jgi:hypothetical protein
VADSYTDNHRFAIQQYAEDRGRWETIAPPTTRMAAIHAVRKAREGGLPRQRILRVKRKSP